MEGLAKEPICIARGHIQQCGESQGRGAGGWVEVGKGGQNGRHP